MEHEELYLIRNGLTSIFIAKYIHVKDNIYKDTTCSGHENCLISVKEEDGKIVFNSAENDTAREYIYFHQDCGEFYTSKLAACQSFYRKHKSVYEKLIISLKSDIEKTKSKILKRELRVKYLESLETINFDDNLFALRLSKKEIIPLVVTWKKETKNGIVQIGGYLEDNKEIDFNVYIKYLKEVNIRNIDYRGESSFEDEYDTLMLFPTKKSAENFIKNDDSKNAISALPRLENRLKGYEDNLKELEYKIENNVVGI